MAERITQGFVHSGLENLPRWKLQNLLGQPTLLLLNTIRVELYIILLLSYVYDYE